MRFLFMLLILMPACALLPDGRQALSLDEAVAVLQGAADDAGQADLNEDGLLQVDSNSGVPLAALQAYLRSNADGLLASDANGDGMLDDRELLGAAPMMAARLYMARESMGMQDADGSVGELAMLGLLLADRLNQALQPVQ